MKISRKNGAQKHVAMALWVKARIVHENRPETARAYLGEARELSTKMGARPLLEKVGDTLKDFQHISMAEKPSTGKRKP